MKRVIYKLFKCIILLFIGILMFNIFEPKPFKFENFKTKEEAQAYFDKHYPVGSNVDLLFEDLKKVGAKYTLRKEKIPPQQMGEHHMDLEYEKVYIGKYPNNWISSDPMGYYDLYIFIDEQNEICDISVYRWSKFS